MKRRSGERGGSPEYGVRGQRWRQDHKERPGLGAARVAISAVSSETELSEVHGGFLEVQRRDNPYEHRQRMALGQAELCGRDARPPTARVSACCTALCELLRLLFVLAQS